MLALIARGALFLLSRPLLTGTAAVIGDQTLADGKGTKWVWGKAARPISDTVEEKTGFDVSGLLGVDETPEEKEQDGTPSSAFDSASNPDEEGPSMLSAEWLKSKWPWLAGGAAAMWGLSYVTSMFNKILITGALAVAAYTGLSYMFKNHWNNAANPDGAPRAEPEAAPAPELGQS